MSEAEKPKKRAYWQIHLSTAVILVVVAGLLLAFVIKEVQANLEYAAKLKYPAPKATGWSKAVVLFYILILMGVGGSCEWFIRRREARKT
jgi:succinate dehydrogenase hydrophobic anchor subunit